MKLKLTADMVHEFHNDPNHARYGEVAIRLNGYTVKSLIAARPVGAEPDAEENLILETIWEWLEGQPPANVTERVVHVHHYEPFEGMP